MLFDAIQLNYSPFKLLLNGIKLFLRKKQLSMTGLVVFHHSKFIFLQNSSLYKFQMALANDVACKAPIFTIFCFSLLSCSFKGSECANIYSSLPHSWHNSISKQIQLKLSKVVSKETKSWPYVKYSCSTRGKNYLLTQTMLRAL